MRRQAARFGLDLRFVKKIFGPEHAQNRVCINGHRCHLIPGSSLNSNFGEAVDLRVPQNVWARFLISVPEPAAENEKPFYIIPRSRLAGNPSQAPIRLRDYADAWHLLGRRDAQEKTQACRRCVTQTEAIPAGAVPTPSLNYSAEPQ